MSFDVRPVTLYGGSVRLEPLAEGHFKGLAEAGSDASIWTYLLGVQGCRGEVFRAWFDSAMAGAVAGTDLPFAIIEAQSGRVVGSTRYMDIRRAHYGLEIGWTWLTPSAQRTAINTETKFLLLEHAFEKLKALRVQLKTDAQNVRSQAAIERIGGVREGVLRRHMICADGRVRDTVYYSVIAGEWSGVKKALLEKLKRSRNTCAA